MIVRGWSSDSYSFHLQMVSCFECLSTLFSKELAVSCTLLFGLIGIQYFLVYPVATGHNFSKRGSDNPKRPVKQNYTFGHHAQ